MLVRRKRLLGILLPLALGNYLCLPLGYAQELPAPMVSVDPAPVATVAPALVMPVTPGVPVPPPVHAGYASVAPPSPNYPTTPMPPWVPPGTAPADSDPGTGVHGWLRRHNLYCWSHHDSPGCGSLKAEYIYIFGSCRDWYGEPCMPRPEQYPPAPTGWPGANGSPVPHGWSAPAQKSCGCSW